MNELSDTELRALEEMEPHDFHRVLMQIVAGGMTAWRNESARPGSAKTRRRREPPLVAPTPITQESVEIAEAFV
jgi:hypothetical protein